MKAGILKETIEIYKPIQRVTKFGDATTEYEFFYKTKSAVKYNSGSRQIMNDEIVYPSSRQFIIRHYVPVLETMRIKYDNKFYQIISIEPNKYYNDKSIIADLVNE